MLLVRRATAFFVSLLTLQLTLLGNGALCADVASGNSGISASMTAVGGMDMAGMSATRTESAGEMPLDGEAADPQRSESCGVGASAADCGRPHTGADCDAMMTCVPLAIGVAVQTASAGLAWRSEAPVGSYILALLSRSTAPESPPPRA